MARLAEQIGGASKGCGWEGANVVGGGDSDGSRVSEKYVGGFDDQTPMS